MGREMSTRALAGLAREERKEGGVLGWPARMGLGVEERRDREEGRWATGWLGWSEGGLGFR